MTDKTQHLETLLVHVYVYFIIFEIVLGTYFFLYNLALKSDLHLSYLFVMSSGFSQQMISEVTQCNALPIFFAKLSIGLLNSIQLKYFT